MQNNQVVAKIDGKVISAGELAQWKKGRIKDVCGKLRLGEIPDGDMNTMMDELTRRKLALSYEEIHGRVRQSPEPAL